MAWLAPGNLSRPADREPCRDLRRDAGAHHLRLWSRYGEELLIFEMCSALKGASRDGEQYHITADRVSR